MNNNFGPDFGQSNEPREPLMSELERRAHKSVFSKLCFAYLAYLLVTNLLAIAASYILQTAAPGLLEDYNVSLIISSVIQYLIAFPVLVLMIKRIPARAPEASHVSAVGFLKYGAASLFIMYAGNYISMMIMTFIETSLGIVPENSVDTLLDQSNILLSVVIVGIIGPIVEELMFRKLFIDRLTPYGEAVAIFFPALMFGFFHGNLYQFFYAFFLGVVFSYVYVRTGKIIYSTILHMFINLFCGVLPSYLMSLFNYEEFVELALAGTLTEEYVQSIALPLALFAVYEVAMLVAVFAGLAVFLKNIMKISFRRGEVRFPRGEALDVMFINGGTIALIVVCVIMMAVNTFAV